MPNFDIFSKEYYNDDIKLNYYIEEQKDSYSKDDWNKCFELFNKSRKNGKLAEVAK